MSAANSCSQEHQCHIAKQHARTGRALLSMHRQAQHTFTRARGDVGHTELGVGVVGAPEQHYPRTQSTTSEHTRAEICGGAAACVPKGTRARRGGGGTYLR